MAASAADAVADAEIAVICVSDTPDVEAVLFGPDGVVAGARPGTLIIDCSTIAPSSMTARPCTSSSLSPGPPCESTVPASPNESSSVPSVS